MTDTKPQPFDERSALAQLEQLAEKIQSTRRQRERAVAEFNAFVKTFKDENHATRLSALQAVSRPEPRPFAPPPVPPIPAPPAVERRASEPAPAITVAAEPPPVTAPPQTEPEPTSWSSPPPSGFDVSTWLQSTRGRIAIGAAAVIVVILIVSWFLRSTGGQSAADNRPAPAPAAQTAPPVVTKPSEGTPVASTGPTDMARMPARAVNVVLVTSRPVWTRAIVDDRKVIEREIPAGQTIPLGADRAITIRAGDAGAMKLIVDGKDLGVMGRDGQIASRTFSAPAGR